MAAFFSGKYSQAFPHFGVERRGAPVVAFARISDRYIRLRSQIYSPDYVIIQDPTLLEVIDVARGLKDDGAAIINAEKPPEEVSLNTRAKVYTVNATKVALEVLGVPIVNTVMLGAFSAITKEVSLEALKKAIDRRFSPKLAEKNKRAVEVMYEKVVREWEGR
jgi:pyruvate ferredoxin oxidoreductase gamma subunit